MCHFPSSELYRKVVSPVTLRLPDDGACSKIVSFSAASSSFVVSASCVTAVLFGTPLLYISVQTAFDVLVYACDSVT